MIFDAGVQFNMSFEILPCNHYIMYSLLFWLFINADKAVLFFNIMC